MKGVILAGGLGSRLMPITKVTNKHLLPVGDKPIIYYPIETLKSFGVDKIMIVTGPENCGHFMRLLGDGSELGVDITYKVQTQPDGIVGALRLCEDYIGEQKSFVVILGDNIFDESICKIGLKNPLIQQNNRALVILKEVDDPERFGVAEMLGKEIINIEEKPEKPKSNLAVTGLYFYPRNVFRVMKDLKKSDRGEYEITDVNNWYIKNSFLYGFEFDGFWSDVGTFESMYKTTKHLMGDKE